MFPSIALCETASLDEPEALEGLLLLLLEKRPPLWLAGAASNGEVHGETIPDAQGQLISEIVPDLARREAILLAAGRRHEDATLSAVGELGEEHVVKECRKELNEAGRPDLGERVSRVSLRSDQLGWDVDAPSLTSTRRKLEVKTTRSQGPTIKFHLSRNEARIGLQDPEWALVFCRVDRSQIVHVVGWCRMDTVVPLLPSDQHQWGRWEQAVLLIEEADLDPGLPVE